MSDDDVARVFDLVDKDGGGSITPEELVICLGPPTRPNRASVCAARTLNPIGQARVTLSPR